MPERLLKILNFEDEVYAQGCSSVIDNSHTSVFLCMIFHFCHSHVLDDTEMGCTSFD